MCNEPLCREATLRGFKKKRHFVTRNLKRQLPKAIEEHMIDHINNPRLAHKRIDQLLGRNHVETTFEMLHDEVLNEYLKKDDDNSATVTYQENAFGKTKNGANWVPPFWTLIYDQVTEDMVFNWYLQLEDYMLKNKNYHGLTYKDGKFKQIDDAVKRISEHGVLVHKLQPIHAERTRILSAKIKQNLKANYRTIEGEFEFNPQLVANMVSLIDQIATYEDKRYSQLNMFMKTAICLCTRAGETCGLQIGDVQFGLHNQHTLVHVQRQTRFQQKTAKLIEGGRKTGIVTTRTKRRNKRQVPVTDQRVDQFLRHTAMEFETGQKQADNFGADTIFRNRANNPVVPADIRSLLKRFATKYNTRFIQKYGQNFEGYSLHSLRHAGASFLQAETEDIVLVKNILGHQNISMTANTYGHATAQQLLKAPDMTSILGGGSQ